jgi:hypothetical protein
MNASESARAHLVFAFRRVLRPLVKVLLRAGVRFDEFSEVLKAVYIESAIKDEIIHIKPLTRARVALATGVTRHDVDRLITDPTLLKTPRATNVPMLAAILNKWHSDSNYLGPYGMPLELAIDKPSALSFRLLSESIDKSLDWLQLLEDLLSSGVVSKSGEHYVKVHSRTFVMPEPMSAKMLEHFGNTLTNLANTLEYNMDPGKTDKRVERAVFPDDGLPAELSGEFTQFIRALVQEMINDVENWISDATKGRTFSDAERIQTGLSVFHYLVKIPDERPLDEFLVDDKK